MCLNKASKYPCGKCYECLSKRRSDWSIRLQEELKSSGFAYHAILTYDDDHLRRSKNGLATLYKKDCQDFIKRLRHKFDHHISYFLAGEYGHYTQRPHIHIIIFGVPEFDDIKFIHRDKYSEKLRKLIENAWQNGFVRFESKYIVSDAQLHYVTKDIYNWVAPLDLDKVYKTVKNKRNGSKLYENFIRNTFKPYLTSGCSDDRLLPFRLFSKNLGIGYLDRTSKISDSLEAKYYDTFLPRYDSFHSQYRCPPGYVPYNIYFIRQDIYDSLEFDELGRLVIPYDIIKEFDKLYKKVELRKDCEGRSKLNSTNYSLPRYYVNRILSYSLRSFFALKVLHDNELKRMNYLQQHGKYDASHDVPYYILSAQNQFHNYYKSHKDRFVDKKKYL